MTNDELPDNQQDRVSWVIRAPDNAELRRRYDLWAQQYDQDVGNVEDYLAPRELVAVASRTYDTSARIMDAGAGTGLVGQSMKDAGFETLIAAAPTLVPQARGGGALSPSEIADPARRPTGCAFHPRCVYAEAACRAEVPVLRPLDDDADPHRVACHRAEALHLRGVSETA